MTPSPASKENILSNVGVAAILEEENRRNNREDRQTSSRQVEALVVIRGRSMEPGSSGSRNHGVRKPDFVYSAIDMFRKACLSRKDTIGFVLGVRISLSKHGDKVLIAQPMSEFNPTIGVQVVNKPIDVVVADNTDMIKKPIVADNADVVKKLVVANKVSVVADKAPVAADKASVVPDKASVVADKHKAAVVNPSNVVADKSIKLVIADNADVGKVEVSVLKGSLSIDVVSDNVQDDPAKVVKENLLSVVNDKALDAL
ncbi:hypothetical protein Tco_0157382 [Tanacetum coccineum]